MPRGTLLRREDARDVELHVLPSGMEHSPALATLTMGRGEKVSDRVRAAYEATAEHLSLRA